MQNRKNQELDKRTINYRRSLEVQESKSVKTLSEKLHDQVAKKTIGCLMKFAYTTDQSYKSVNRIFNMSTTKDWFEFLKMTEGCTQIARVYESHGRPSAESFFVHTVQLVNEQYPLQQNSENDENFFTHNMNFDWAI